MTPKGTATQRRYGLNLPNRELVLSANTPTTGSKHESQILVTKNIVPAAAADIPKMSV